MSKIEAMSLTNTKNVEEARIGESTMNLLRCKAMLSDIFIKVSDILDNTSGGQSVREDVRAKFETAFTDFNAWLTEILADVMDYVSSDSEYKVI